MERSSYPDDMRQIARIINQRPGRMIQLASLLNCQASFPMYFGDNEPVTTIESGILFYITNSPGVTNATLATQFGRTKGAISQLVKKLETKGYILREVNPSDAKSSLLYPSLQGVKLIQQINEDDITNNRSMLHQLLEHCSMEDIQTFYRMVDIYTVLLIQLLSDARSDSLEKDGDTPV